jgi:hypothetical protein
LRRAWCDLVKRWKPLDRAEETAQIASASGRSATR